MISCAYGMFYRLTVTSQAIRHRRIPVIHGAQVVLVEDERDAGGFAKAAIGKADSVSLEELRRRGLVRVVTHKKSSWRKSYEDRTNASCRLRPALSVVASNPPLMISPPSTWTLAHD